MIAVKKTSEHKESACEKAALQLLAEAEKGTLPNMACEKKKL
jgi:hypothetical protein